MRIDIAFVKSSDLEMLKAPYFGRDVSYSASAEEIVGSDVFRQADPEDRGHIEIQYYLSGAHSEIDDNSGRELQTFVLMFILTPKYSPWRRALNGLGYHKPFEL